MDKNITNDLYDSHFLTNFTEVIEIFFKLNLWIVELTH